METYPRDSKSISGTIKRCESLQTLKCVHLGMFAKNELGECMHFFACLSDSSDQKPSSASPRNPLIVNGVDFLPWDLSLVNICKHVDFPQYCTLPINRFYLRIEVC